MSCTILKDSIYCDIQVSDTAGGLLGSFTWSVATMIGEVVVFALLM